MMGYVVGSQISHLDHVEQSQAGCWTRSQPLVSTVVDRLVLHYVVD